MQEGPRGGLLVSAHDALLRRPPMHFYSGVDNRARIPRAPAHPVYFLGLRRRRNRLRSEVRKPLTIEPSSHLGQEPRCRRFPVVVWPWRGISPSRRSIQYTSHSTKAFDCSPDPRRPRLAQIANPHPIVNLIWSNFHPQHSAFRPGGGRGERFLRSAWRTAHAQKIKATGGFKGSARRQHRSPRCPAG